MKIRIPFSFKIFFPYLLTTILFFILFLGLSEDDAPFLTWISAAGILISLGAAMVSLWWLRTPLNRVRRLVSMLTRGAIPDFRASGARDEIGDLERNLETMVNNLGKMASFTRSMASGDFSGEYRKLSSEDELGEALITLKGSLMKSQEETEKRHREEEERTWSAQGMAKFSSLFREAEDNLQDLANVLMKELVAYTSADVGALFISGEKDEKGDPELELYGAFAFDREKSIQKSFAFGEGLVGRAAIEKEAFYITEMPPDHIKIRSGLGEDRPSSLFLVPVLLDNNVLGVMELASLGEIPVHQREFIVQMAEALATTLAKIRANLQTKRLFEQSRKQAKELASQEKVFMQNLERMESEKKEYLRKEEKLMKEIKTLRKETH